MSLLACLHVAAYLAILTTNSNASMWLGLTELGINWNFVWSNQETVDRTYWAAGEPEHSTVILACASSISVACVTNTLPHVVSFTQYPTPNTV